MWDKGNWLPRALMSAVTEKVFVGEVAPLDAESIGTEIMTLCR